MHALADIDDLAHAAITHDRRQRIGFFTAPAMADSFLIDDDASVECMAITSEITTVTKR